MSLRLGQIVKNTYYLPGESIIFYIIFFYYLLKKLERSWILVLPSHMNSWKSEKNDDFVYVAGNVGEHL